MMGEQFAKMMCRAAATEIAKLSIRICKQAKAGEPLGELDIVNDLYRIGAALAKAGGVDYAVEYGEEIELGG